MGLALAIFIVTWIFGKILLENIFLLFFIDFKLLLFHVRISGILNKWNVENLHPHHLPIFAKFLL